MTDRIAEAQVHATLAIAEQLRISNLIALANASHIQNYCWETERGMPDPDEIRADIEGES